MAAMQTKRKRGMDVISCKSTSPSEMTKATRLQWEFNQRENVFKGMPFRWFKLSGWSAITQENTRFLRLTSQQNETNYP